MQFGLLPCIVRAELASELEYATLRGGRVLTGAHTAGLSRRHVLAILSYCEDLRARTCNFQTPS
jgi:hypothetical protein